MSVSLKDQVDKIKSKYNTDNFSNMLILIFRLFIKQIHSFLEGFYYLIPHELISIFDPTQLDLLVCGLPDIDIEDLRAHTNYQVNKFNTPHITLVH